MKKAKVTYEYNIKLGDDSSEFHKELQALIKKYSLNV